MPLLVLGLAALCCLGPTLGLGIDFRRGTDLGPIADAFYLLYSRLRAKERALWAAVAILVIGVPLSAAFIGFS